MFKAVAEALMVRSDSSESVSFANTLSQKYKEVLSPCTEQNVTRRQYFNIAALQQI